MPYQRFAVIHQKASLRSAALAANIEDFPEVKPKIDRLFALLALLRELTAEQARLTAARQGVSKQIADLTDETQKLMTSLDVMVKQHYGKSSEKLAEYGLQPYRSKPRTRRVEPEGHPPAEAETPE
jgi:hypothetical protein